MYYPRVTGPNLPTAEGGTINGFASEKCITPDTSYADTSWKNTQAIINEMILAMQQCDAADTRYQLNPTIVFNYDANKDGQYLYKYGDSASEMKLQASAEANDDSSGDVITDGGEETVPYTQCQDSKDGVCKDVPARFLHTSLGGENPKLYSTYTEKNISYSLPDGGGYKYVSKNDGSAFKILSGDIESKGLYTSYDDSILPLDYKLSSGTYYIGFTYSDIGNSAHKQTPHFTYMLQNNQIADFTDTGPYEYVCKFRIKNDILKDCAYECNKYDTACIDAACGTPPRCTNGSTAANCPSGITVIYRTIQLQKDSSGISKTDLAASFPSYNANGRSPGVNWSTSDVASYITNNRGVYGNEVYSKTPMYEITLTPSTIIQIRNYNKQENDNNRGGYADFNYSMSCVKGTGRNCISSFIHSKFSILFSGTCMNATQSDFLSCQKAG